MASVGSKRPSGYVPPQVSWVPCATCGKQERTSALIRLANQANETMLCFECYLDTTGGEWRRRDQYWDGSAWIPLARGL